jgi:RNA polymerase sigma-70 factor, ECF subfamily
MTSELDHETERFAVWVREHSRAVRGYLFGMTRRADAADDLLQEVFRRAWQARAAYRENGHPRAYLLKIADRLVCDRSRKTRREINFDGDDWKQHEPETNEDGPAQTISRKEEAAQLDRALRCLSPAQRRVLLLRFYGQMSFAEIAAETGHPLGTVLSHCHRGLESLRTLLTEEPT